MITAMVPVLHLPGRLAAVVVAAILLCGHLWRNHNQQSLRLLPVTLPEQGAHDFQGNSDDLTVSVKVSIESLCIDSKNYLLEQIVPTFDSPLRQVMDLQVIVFGNAQLHTASQTVTCQHGNAECDANVWQQCAIDNFVYPSRYLPFLECLFTDLPMGHADIPYETSLFASCARASALEFSALQACHDHDAWAMQVQNAAQTPADHDHVPWVVIDGVYTSEEENSLANVVCETLKKKGGSHPYCETL